MNHVALLGTGAMGSRMAARLLGDGMTVTVWNRTPGRAAALESAGARLAESPAAAVADADVALSMVRDDEASRDVWLDPARGALAALRLDAIGVECSTLSLPHLRTLADAFARAGRTLVDAPLAGSRPQAEAGQLIFFAGGEAAAVDRLRPVLEPMAGGVHHAGPVGSGAAVKLIVNAMFGLQVGALAELIGFADAAGVDAARAIEIVAATPVCSPAAAAAANAMLAGAWAPAFPIELVAKDFALVARSADDAGASLPIGSAAGAVFADADAAGLGGDNITGVVQRYRRFAG